MPRSLFPPTDSETQGARPPNTLLRRLEDYNYDLIDGIHGVNMAVKDDVIKAMKEAGKPMSAGEVEKATGIDRKEIDKAFKELKAEGAIVSPVRCKWEPAQ